MLHLFIYINLTMTKIAKAIAQAVDQAEGGVQAMLDG